MTPPGKESLPPEPHQITVFESLDQGAYVGQAITRTAKKQAQEP